MTELYLGPHLMIYTAEVIVTDTNQDPISIQQMYCLKMAKHAFNNGFQKKVMVADVYKLISGVISDDSDRDQVMEAVKTNSLLRSHYQTLVRKKRTFFVPVAAAAASDNMIFERRTEEFSIKIISSKYKTGTTYVVIELFSSSIMKPYKRLVVHAYSNEVLESTVFSTVHDNKAQIVVNEDDPFLLAIADRNTEISIVFE